MLGRMMSLQVLRLQLKMVLVQQCQLSFEKAEILSFRLESGTSSYNQLTLLEAAKLLVKEDAQYEAVERTPSDDVSEQ
jgi:hypothetical protein